MITSGQHNPFNAAAGGVAEADGAGQQEHRQHRVREQVRRGHQASKERYRLRRFTLPVIYIFLLIKIKLNEKKITRNFLI